MEVQIIQFLAQNKELLLPIVVILSVMFIFKKNESLTQYAIKQAEEREKALNSIIDDVMSKGEKREHSLMDLINGQLAEQTKALVSVNNSMGNVCKSLGELTDRVDRVEHELDIKGGEQNDFRKLVG